MCVTNLVQSLSQSSLQQNVLLLFIFLWFMLLFVSERVFQPTLLYLLANIFFSPPVGAPRVCHHPGIAPVCYASVLAPPLFPSLTCSSIHLDLFLRKSSIGKLQSDRSAGWELSLSPLLTLLQFSQEKMIPQEWLDKLLSNLMWLQTTCRWSGLSAHSLPSFLPSRRPVAANCLLGLWTGL